MILVLATRLFHFLVILTTCSIEALQVQPLTQTAGYLKFIIITFYLGLVSAFSFQIVPSAIFECCVIFPACCSSFNHFQQPLLLYCVTSMTPDCPCKPPCLPLLITSKGFPCSHGCDCCDGFVDRICNILRWVHIEYKPYRGSNIH